MTIACDPRVPADAKPRLSTQCAEILALLATGAASNDQLSMIARKYTSRISDLRKAGYRIVNFDHNKKTGLAWYRLEPTGVSS